MTDRIAIVAIAKNESKFLAEWAAWHLALGVDQIRVYANDCKDNTEWIARSLGSDLPVEAVYWPSKHHASPQRAAYAHAVRTLEGFEWVGFIDIDEFLVPHGWRSLHAFLGLMAKDIGAVAINWRNFGSSGVTDPNYQSVVHTFRRCSKRAFWFNQHTKIIARLRDIHEMAIHDVMLKEGGIVDSAFNFAAFVTAGRMPQPVYNGIQINHYQLKTREEFMERRKNGNSNQNPDHWRHAKPATLEQMMFIDRNEEMDTTVERFFPAFDKMRARVRATLADAPCGPRLVKGPDGLGGWPPAPTAPPDRLPGVPSAS